MIRRHMNRWFYAFGWQFSRFVMRQCVNLHALHAERLKRAGPALYACTHLSHLEPFIVSPLIERPIHWMARTEFYKYRWSTQLLNWGGCIPVKRRGRPVRAIRSAITKLGEGRLVGIFPEGGVAHGPVAAFRGGAIKRGVATIALRARVPIVPVVMLGTDTLNCIEPWLPARQAHVWMHVGEDVRPISFTRSSSRAARIAVADELSRRFIEGYEALVRHFGLDPRKIP